MYHACPMYCHMFYIMYFIRYVYYCLCPCTGYCILEIPTQLDHMDCPGSHLSIWCVYCIISYNLADFRIHVECYVCAVLYSADNLIMYTPC